MTHEDPQRPHLYRAREREDEEREDAHARALRLARQIEELLESTPSIGSIPLEGSQGAHGTRMARAMAASLVDELEAIVRGKNRISIA